MDSDRQIDQCSSIEFRYRPYKYGQLIFDKDTKGF